MADKSALALAMRPKSSSHHSLDPIGAPKRKKLEDPFQQHPWKSPGPNDRAEGHAGMTPVLSMLTMNPMRRKPSMRAMRKQRTAGAEPAQKTVIEEERAEIDSQWVGGLRVSAGLRSDRVDSEGEKDRAEGIPLLHYPGAGDDLRGNATEECSHGGNNNRSTERERRKTDADGPQDG